MTHCYKSPSLLIFTDRRSTHTLKHWALGYILEHRALKFKTVWVLFYLHWTEIARHLNNGESKEI